MPTKKLTVITVIALLIGTTLGMITQSKLTKYPEHKCPEMKCPDLIHKCAPAIEVQSLDLDRVRKIKGNFTFSPTYNGDVIMKSDTCK